jgi:glycosyltransferase involved in cell wall biosynthesis
MRPELEHIRRRADRHAKSRTERWRRVGSDGSSPPARSQLPRVSVVLATHRVDKIEECRRNVVTQDYPNLELIIVLNNDAYDEASVRETFADVRLLQVVRLAASCNLGSCINLGASFATGSYIAKMDDDDFYGPSYISDLVLSALETGADVLGKKATFFYFEDGQDYCLRHPELFHRWLWPFTDVAARSTFSPKLHGATLFIKRDVIRDFPFDETAPHGTDAIFQRACRRAGLTIYASDEFNFCHLRRAGAEGHLWQITKEGVLEDAVLLASFDRSRMCV